MTRPGDQPNLEHELGDLKASVEKYLTGAARLTSETVGDFARAIHDLSDHLGNLHRRIEKLESGNDEWTTHGWTPPPGHDRPY